MRARWIYGAILLVGIVGCSGGSDDSNVSKPADKKAEIKVALLTPGSVNDGGWNALAYAGLKQIETTMGAKVDQQEASGTQIKDAMRAYAQKGYDLIFGHGFEYNSVALEVAKDFPKTIFATSSGSGTAANVGAFRFYLEQGFYIAGFVAGKLSKTGTVGMVGVQNYPSIVSTFKAFEAGARAAKPTIKIIPPVYFGKEGDTAGAKQATEQVIAQGADFVIHQANAAANGVFAACAEKHIFAFGANADQNADPSGAVIASATIVASPAFVTLAHQVQSKTFKGEVLLMGMEKGSIDFIENPKFASKFPQDLKDSIKDLRGRIKSGKLVVPKDAL